MVWKLIETAPRDGTRIRAREGSEVFFCRWWTVERLQEYDFDASHGWYEDVGVDGKDGARVDPTHWYDPSKD